MKFTGRELRALSGVVAAAFVFLVGLGASAIAQQSGPPDSTGGSDGTVCEGTCVNRSSGPASSAPQGQSGGGGGQSCGGSAEVTYTTDEGTKRNTTTGRCAPAPAATAAPAAEPVAAARTTRRTAAPLAASQSPSASPLASPSPLPTAVLGPVDTASPAELTDTQPQGSSNSGLILLLLAVLAGGACYVYFFFRRRERMSQFSTPTPATLGPFGPAPAGAMLPATDNGYRFDTSPNLRSAHANGFDSGPATDVIVLPHPDHDGRPASSPLAENAGYWEDMTFGGTQATPTTGPRERPFSPIVELRFVTDGELVDAPNDDIFAPAYSDLRAPNDPRATSEIDVIDLRLGN